MACRSDPWREHIIYNRAGIAHADTINKSEWLRSQELISLKLQLPGREQAHSSILKCVRINDSPAVDRILSVSTELGKQLLNFRGTPSNSKGPRIVLSCGSY